MARPNHDRNMLACIQLNGLHWLGGAQLRFLANAVAEILASDHTQSLSMGRTRFWRIDTGDPSPLMAASLLQLDVGFAAPGLTAGELLGRVTQTGMLSALSQVAAMVGCAKSTGFSREGGMTSKELQVFSWKEYFKGAAQWWGNRQGNPTPRHPFSTYKESKLPLLLRKGHKPAWMDSQLATWDAGMKMPPDSGSMSVQRQGAVGRLELHEGHLQVETCRRLCEHGRITDALDALKLLLLEGCHLPNNLFYTVLKRCKDLVLIRRIHSLSVECGYEGDTFLATHLIGLYALHGSLEEAMRVFAMVSTPSSYNWATIIFAYARHGEAAGAIRLYRHMHKSSAVTPTDHIHVAVLKACAAAGDLVAGKEVHGHILESSRKPNNFVQTGLVNMYAKCGSLEDARSIFDRLPDKNVVTWTVMIAGYSRMGMGQEALRLYSTMQHEGITPPDSVTFVSLLQSCVSIGERALQQGKQLHAQIEEEGLQNDVLLGGRLVNMYAKCGSLEDARSVFDTLPAKSVVTWTAMIAGYAQQGMGQEALTLYTSMQQVEITPPDSVTYVCLLQACASAGALYQGNQLHAQIEEQGLQDDVVVGGSLVNMYAKCGSLEDARSLFDRLQAKNVVTWNAMIAGYAQQDMGQEALSLYSSMQREGLTPPDAVAFVCLLQACAIVGPDALDQGKQLHAQVEEQGLKDDVVLGGSLVNMYAKCGSLEDARRVFDKLPVRNVVTWTSMIAGYSQQEMGQEALNLYSTMQQEGLTPPHPVTFVCLLQACASVGVGALDNGKQLHAQIEERGLHRDVVLGGSLVHMYAKCGSLHNARKVFDRLAARNVITWTAMIAGYAEQGMGEDALSIFMRMQLEGVTPNSVTFVCLLQACAGVTTLPLGKQLHALIEERGLQTDSVVGGTLVNMYAKCGSMFDSQRVFDSLPERTIEAWNALVGGYTRQGDSEVVFDLLDRMGLEGIQPDGITFLSVLTVCSHVGLVDKGRKYFDAMRTDYAIKPTIEHYTCMIDLLGRAGNLDEAMQVAKTMPFPPNYVVWLTLLGSCRTWNNMEIGKQAFEFAVSVDDKKASPYVLMSSIYASAEMGEEARKIQARRLKSGAWKKPGQSWWTDMGGVLHTFVVGDKNHYENVSMQGCCS